MYSNQLKIGMTLYCDDGYSTVELLDIQNDNTILVRYKGKQYRRDISIIGKRLFINPVNPKKTNVVRQERNSTPIQPTKVESSDTSRVIKTSIQPDNSKTYDLNGYDKEGYDKNGYNAEGYNKQGFDRYGFDKHGFDSYGYDKKGFNANGYNRLGFDAHGYNSDGFDATGFDRKGYNRLGYDVRGRNREGYDRYGYNANGYNKQGFDRYGFDKYGFDAYGYDKKGFNKQGYNRNGYDRSGYNALGYDKNGFDKNGYNKEGYDREGYDKDGYNKFDLNKNLKFRPGSIVGESLIPHITKLYHIVFGEGILLSLDVKEKELHLCVEFTSGSKIFVYPNCFSDGYLKLEKSDEMRDFEEFLNTPNGRKIFDEENSFLTALSASIKADVALAEKNYTDATYSLQSVEDDSWSPKLSEKLKQTFSDTYREQLRMYSIRREPYFARIDAGEDSFYIGKNEYKDVIEWTNPLASLYYEYQMYIGNNERKLSLVRDLSIYVDTICSIRDKYNAQTGLNDRSLDFQNEVISDPNLLLIINANRDNKTVHDIIATIQNNQYMIITKSVDENLVVSGCAGSGKTMIMLHRLRYLLRNNSTLSPRNIIVLSPTDALTNESSQLAMLLGMDDIGVFSNMRLYSFILQNICKKSGWSFINKKVSYRPNDFIDREQIKSIYNEQTLNLIYENVSQIIHDPEQKNMYLSMSFEEIRIKKIDFLGLSYVECKEEELFQTLTDALSKFDEFNKSFSVEKIKEFKKNNNKKLVEKIKELKKNNNKNRKREARIKNKIREYEANIKALDLLLEHTELLSSTTLHNSDGQIPNGSSPKSLYEFLKIIHWDTDKAYCGIADPIDMFEEYYLPISQCEKRVTAFRDGDDYACLLDIVNFAVKTYKDKIGIEDYQHCEWELFVQVYVLSNFSQFTFNNSELLFVDEYQDYSICELKVLDKLFPNAVFNYFGDPDQAISAKSSSKQAIFEYFDNKSAVTHSINENYRNAKEITEYVNSEMNMHMRPVGISGQVAKIELNAIPKITIDADDRVALICKKELVENLYHYIVHTLNVKCNLISDQGNELQRGLINIVPVSLTKGLEFEKVVVAVEGMSFNERYVSFTRALNELYVVD